MLKLIPTLFLLVSLSACLNIASELKISGLNFFNSQGGSALSCPTQFGEYHLIEANTKFQTPAFCVMKYEAKCLGADCPSATASTNAMARSVPQGLPWVSITRANAHQACRALGENYHLISNPEWMAISQLITQQPQNWFSNTIGVDNINRGHSDGNPASILEVTDPDEYYDNTGNNSTQGASAGWDQRRAHFLDSTRVIWDMGGNAAEYINWNREKNLTNGPTDCANSFAELPDIVLDVGCSLQENDYLPEDPSWDSTFGMGQLRGGTTGEAMRGSLYLGPRTNRGIYYLILNRAVDSTATDIGFRCVYRF